MLETAIVAFSTFFATIGPIDVSVMFAAMPPMGPTGCWCNRDACCRPRIWCSFDGPLQSGLMPRFLNE